MSSKYVRDTVSAYLDANWVATPIYGDENEFELPPELLDPWMVYGFEADIEEQLSIGAPGSNCFEEAGTVYITVYVASGTGTDVALTYAEDVRTMMRGLQPGVGLRFNTIDPPDTASPSTTQSSFGNWYGYEVACHYIYNYSA